MRRFPRYGLGRRSPHGGSFSPLLPGLLARYQINPSYCFADVAGTVPAGHLDPVACLKEQRGSGPDLVQAAAGSRPVLHFTGTAWELVFDGADDSLQTAEFGPVVVSAFEAHAAMTATAGIMAEFRRVADAGQAIAGDFHVHGAAFESYTRNDAILDSRDIGARPGGMTYMDTRWDGAATHGSVAGGAESTGAIAGDITIADFTLGRDGHQAGSFSDLVLREYVFYARALTDLERPALRAYMAGVAGA